MRKALLVRFAAMAVVWSAVGCASSPQPAPPTVAPPPPPPPSLDTRTGWILRLENERRLDDPDWSAPGAAAAAASAGAALTPDLARLVADSAPSIRRRAAVAIGRIKDPAGLPLLVTRLEDAVPEVQAAAAFAIGLLGDSRGAAPLVAAIGNPSALVRGRIIEALGLLGDKSAAPAVTRAAAGCQALLMPLEPDVEPPPSDELSLCRLALFALVRLGNYDGIEAIVLDATGRPASRWWPVAYALQRINDPRAAPALRVLAAVPSVYTAGFALRGLAALKDAPSLPVARGLVARREGDVKARIAAVRLLAQIGSESDVKLLLSVLAEGATASPLALEVIAALGALGRAAAFETLVDLFGDPAPAVRSAALASAAKVDAERFQLILAGLGRDRDWSVRASLAPVLATLPATAVTPALFDLAADEDVRVRSAALQALAAVKAPNLAERLFVALEADDFVVRGTAARLIGESKPAGGVPRLVTAWTRAAGDAAYGARAAALDALAAYGGDEAIRAIEAALSDKEWPVRTKAATLLTGLGRPTASPARPAPTRQPASFFESEAFLHPRFSPHALIDTPLGTIELQLDVVEAPITSATFVELARAGFFNGIKVHRLVPTFVIQAGDPRGDGEGGPGFTLRDELSPTPYLRGTVGMALDWADTGGSQWFITLSPQPHLDAKYTAFGRVVNGWDVLDRVAPWDVVERIRIWDGVELR